MKVFREITSNWDEKQVEFLRQHGIKTEVGIGKFKIYDLNLYKELSPFFDKWEVALDFLGTDFTTKEIKSAEYSILAKWTTFGYPMPDHNLGYLYNTYETNKMCSECGIGIVQKEDFRVRKVPNYPFWGLGWIFDEFFVRKDFYEIVFKPLGIKCRPLRKYKDNSIIDSYVQLVIPVTDESLDLSTYEFETCPKCGVKKFNPKTFGYYPLQDHPLPFIYKSKELFGGGFSANRKIFISSFLRDIMVEKYMMKLWAFEPCAKSGELNIKNKEIMEWEKAGRKIESNTSTFRVAAFD